MSLFLKALALLIFAMPTFGVHVNPVFVIAMALITSAFFVRGLTTELASVYVWK